MFALKLILLSLSLTVISGKEKFCTKDRDILLGGVFNYDHIIFAYSWRTPKEDVPSGQQWMLWRFFETTTGLESVGEVTTVSDVFPNQSFFKTGFGLTMKCQSSDAMCISYRELVFLFFSDSYYRVFRYKDDKFSSVTKETPLPWGLLANGYIKDWFFGKQIYDTVKATAFVSGYQSQIFIITKNILYSTAVDINAKALNWQKLAESKDFKNILGAFVAGNQLLFNKNEAPNSVLLRYDTSGKSMGKLWVWDYFKCGKTSLVSRAGGMGAVESDDWERRQTEHKNTAILILVCVAIVIVLMNIIGAVFWTVVYKKHKTSET